MILCSWKNVYLILFYERGGGGWGQTRIFTGRRWFSKDTSPLFSFTPTPVFLFLRGWRCIRKCLASGSVPLTRPCPSSPSRGSPPTPGEAWHDTIQDKTSRRENKRAERKYREYNVIYTGLHLDTLYLFMPFTGSLHLREYFPCCYCPLLALNGTRKFIFSVGPRRREGYNCELTPRNRSRSRRSRAWKEAVSPFKVTFFISSSASCTLPCLCKVCFKSFFFFFCLCVLYNRMECELVLLRLLFRCDRREMSY